MSIATTARDRISTFLTASIFDNPVVTKEFRARMRGWKAFGVMGAYCLVMTAVLMIAYYFMAEEFSQQGRSHFSIYNSRVSIGRDLFVVLAWAQTILLTLIAPALSAGSITQELERKTLEMLAISPLTAGRIVLGKQLADFMYALILLACSLPLAGITLMLGGISPAEIGITYMLLVAWIFLLTCLGTMLSSLSKKTAAASLSSFGLSIIYLLSASSMGTGLMMSYRVASMSHISLNPFMLLCPAWGPYGALESASVCGVRVSIALASFALHIGYGVLFLLIASSNIKHKPAERALSIRLMLLGIAAYSIWLMEGSVQSPPQKDKLSWMGIWLLVQMIIAAIFFSTGAIKKPASKSMLSYALSWRRVFKSDVGGAILFILIWTAVCYASYGAAIHFRVKAQSLTIPHGYWLAYLRIGVSVLAVVAGMTAVGILASSLVRARNSAAGLMFLFAVVAFAGYGVIASCYAFWRSMGNVHSSNQTLLQLAALWPVTPILSATGTFSKEDAPRWIHSAWIITSLVYVVIGFFSLLLAGKAHARFGGVQEE